MREVLCLLDIGASHNFITQESAERIELLSEEFKAPIVRIPSTKDVPL
jgi:hypothetical protein